SSWGERLEDPKDARGRPFWWVFDLSQIGFKYRVLRQIHRLKGNQRVAIKSNPKPRRHCRTIANPQRTSAAPRATFDPLFPAIFTRLCRRGSGAEYTGPIARICSR